MQRFAASALRARPQCEANIYRNEPRFLAFTPTQTTTLITVSVSATIGSSRLEAVSCTVP